MFKLLTQLSVSILVQFFGSFSKSIDRSDITVWKGSASSHCMIRMTWTKLLTRNEEKVNKDLPDCEKLVKCFKYCQQKKNLESWFGQRHWRRKANGRPGGRDCNHTGIPGLKYGGEISQWQEFWSQYETAIHNNDTLCKTEKFTYLRSYLTEVAARAVARLTMTDTNYDAAIVLLQNRFGRKDIVVSAHIIQITEPDSCQILCRYGSSQAPVRWMWNTDFESRVLRGTQWHI